MAPADPKNFFDPKLKKYEPEFDRSIFSYKETVYGLQYLYVSCFIRSQKTRTVRFLRALLILFLNGPPI